MSKHKALHGNILFSKFFLQTCHLSTNLKLNKFFDEYQVREREGILRESFRIDVNLYKFRNIPIKRISLQNIAM